MRKEFPGHQPLSEQERSVLWERARIILDANALLDIYRLRQSVRDEMLQLLESLRPRLWLPYQFVEEFHRSRVTVIQKALEAHTNLSKALQSIIEQCEAFRIPPHVKPATVDSLRQVLDEFKFERNELFKCLEADPVYERICDLYEAGVGRPLSDARRKGLPDEWRRRSVNGTPPGLRDKKSDGDPPGDLVAWLEIIEHIEPQNDMTTNVLLVTSDLKDDWWIQVDGQTIGPRAELRMEFHRAGGARFWMYSLQRFLEHAKDRLGLAVSGDLAQSVSTTSRDVSLTEPIESKLKGASQDEPRKGTPLEDV